MFELVGHKAIIKGLHLIESNRIVLFNDGDNDILYAGSNKFGNRILGSIVFEDDENDFLRYIHVLVTDYQYYDFLNKKSTLRNILESNESFFLVDFNYLHEEIDHALTTIDDVPESFRPLENSYCPDFLSDPSLSYTVSLKGNLSDLHKVTPEEVNSVNSQFADFVRTATQFINDLSIGRELYIEALEAGSFEINYRLEVKEPLQADMYPPSVQKIETFLNDSFRYIFNVLPTERGDVFQNRNLLSEEFRKLEDELKQIYEEANVSDQNTTVEEKVIRIITNSVEKLKELDYSKSFDRIEISNHSKDGIQIPLGLVNETFVPSVEAKLHSLEVKDNEDLTEIDEFPKDYKIAVYQFNAETGNGGALAFRDDSYEKISLNVSGKDKYHNTIFTKSLDEGKIFTIQGIATFVNGKIKKISVQF